MSTESRVHSEKVSPTTWVVVAVVVAMSGLAVGTARAKEQFYVSPTGSDRNAGTLASPWKTLEKARDHIRTISPTMTGDIIVHLRGGIYYTKFRQDMNCHLTEYDMLDIMPAAVEVKNAEAIALANNTYQHIGCVGVSLINDVVDCEVSGSFFYDVGSAAVNTGYPQHRQIGDGEIFPKGVEGVCRNNRVENNVLRETSVECTQAPAITAFYVQEHRIWHNDLLMTPYTGISLGWDWASACKKEGQPGGAYGGHYGWLPGMSDVMKANSISYNRVEFSMTKLSDGAAIYTLGYQDPVTNSKRPPTDTRGWSELRGNWLHYLGHAGFYCDEGSRYWKAARNAISGGCWILPNPGTRDIRVTDGILGNDSGPLNDPKRNLTEADNTRINYFDPPSAWPKLARDIYEQSGVEAPCRGMVPARLTRNGERNSGVTATQSSGASAAQALDGHVWQHAAARTEAEPNAWWQVDLGGVKEIDYVILHLSTNTAEARELKDVYVFVSETPFGSTDPTATAADKNVWRHFHGGPIWPHASAYRVNWIPVRTRGRYVRIQRASHGALVIPEVIVFESRARRVPEPMSRSDGSRVSGKRHYEPTWESLAQHGTAPPWYEDAVFGIYFHWGIYSVPGKETRYMRHMYMPGHKLYEYHRKTYGDPKEFGYHDFIPMFRAEKWDPDRWAKLFKNSGADFAGSIGEHHDGFSMWDTKYNKFNSMKMGPRRDVVGETARALRKQGLKVVTTFHHLRWQRSDASWSCSPGRWDVP